MQAHYRRHHGKAKVRERGGKVSPVPGVGVGICHHFHAAREALYYVTREISSEKRHQAPCAQERRRGGNAELLQQCFASQSRSTSGKALRRRARAKRPEGNPVQLAPANF